MIGSVLIILKEVCIVLFYIFMSLIPQSRAFQDLSTGTNIYHIIIYWTLFSAHCLCYIHIDKTSSACDLKHYSHFICACFWSQCPCLVYKKMSTLVPYYFLPQQYWLWYIRVILQHISTCLCVCVCDQYPQSSNCKNVHSLKTIGTWAMGRFGLFYTHWFGCCPFITFTISILLLTNPPFCGKFLVSVLAECTKL